MNILVVASNSSKLWQAASVKCSCWRHYHCCFQSYTFPGKHMPSRVDRAHSHDWHDSSNAAFKNRNICNVIRRLSRTSPYERRDVRGDSSHRWPHSCFNRYAGIGGLHCDQMHQLGTCAVHQNNFGQETETRSSSQESQIRSSGAFRYGLAGHCP